MVPILSHINKDYVNVAGKERRMGMIPTQNRNYPSVGAVQNFTIKKFYIRRLQIISSIIISF